MVVPAVRVARPGPNEPGSGKGPAANGHLLIDRHALLEVFEDYARAQLEPYDVGTALYRLTDHASAVLRIDGAGVSLADDDGELRFVAATDQTVAEAEELQIRFGSGPCQQAYRTSSTVSVEDLAGSDKWPDYSPRALEAGFRAVAGIPMPTTERCIGAVDLYHRTPHAWSDEELRHAELLAKLAAGYVVNAQRYEATRTLAEQLRHALDSRVVIEQAKGILAERRAIDPTAAFGLLRTHARRTRARLHDICRQVVDGELDL